ITGIVYDETSIPLADAWITLLSTANIEIGFTLTSADGFFSQPNVSTQPFHLQVEYPYAEKVLISNITLEQKEIKFTTITVNASSEKNKLFFYIYQPKEFLNYNKNIIHFLGRTFPEYKVSLFTDSVSTSTKVFSTGMFAFDNIKLNPAENKVVFTISDSKQNKITQQEFKIIYSTAQPLLPLQPLVRKDFELILPLENDVLLFSGDVLEIKLKAPENKKIYAVWSETLPKILLEETTPGVYEKKYLMPTNVSSARKKLTFELIEEKEFLFFLRKEEIKNVVLEKEVYIELWNSAYQLVAETISEKTPMTYGLHYVRLGGPYITELPKGIKLQIIGKQQDKLKVKLSASLSGWIDQKDVLLIKNATKPPHNFFTYCSITAEKGMDKIWIPWVEQVPFAVTPVVENNKNYIVVDFFNTHLAVTWLTYKSPSKILDNFKAYQIEDDHVQLKIPVKTRQLWGFIVENSTSGVTIYVKYPPKIDKNNPLKNITIALEAGHGGETNLGAIGLSGSKEKNINLKLVNVLKSLLEQHGAKVVLMRVGDTNPDFKQRIQTAIDANANIIISIHANASSTDKGFLRVSGTSVYYKYETSKLLSECIYYELLKLWKDDFGLVGNFNYTPLRQTIIPATLVEQGFMTHPYDEARMLDKNFRKLQAEAILQGIKKFLTLVAE
ncbi:MAG: N-acetylmuramoyl-L-alanine amidase, partial [Endomicrobia bacterium]|nr:N-acetylmuramoyl-L-alanine amidase [Endomicrobiia bacterium]